VAPLAKTKLSELGLDEIGLVPPVEFALSVTGTDRLSVPERTLIKPTSTPEVGAPAPMDTVSTSGVEPDAGVTVSQLLSEWAVTVTFAVPLDEESRIVWDGVVTPVWVLNVSCCGVATTVVVWACSVSKQHRVAAISPSENRRCPMFFTTYSNLREIFFGKTDAARLRAVQRDAVALLHGYGTVPDAFRFQ
jgi:hypothetical protein